MNPRVLLLTTALALAAAAPLAAGEPAWRYVVPAADDPFAHPSPRALVLSDQKPPDLKETAPYRGTKRRYGQLVYGRGRTAPVAIVLDEVKRGEVDLYVDADRDREITAKDRAAGAGPAWKVPLQAVFHEGDALREFPRVVLFRHGAVSRTLAVATCGYLEGRADLAGKPVKARRVDGDANGTFADPQDRLWLDLDGPAGSAFLFTPVLTLGDKRYAVRADALGERLSLAALEGTGTLRLRLPAALKPDQVEDVQVTVQGRDGVVASLRGAGAAVAAPAGEYRVSSLLLTLKAPDGGPPWGYVFGDNGGRDPRWHKLAKDGALALDPVGALDFTTNLGAAATAKPGEALTVRPALYTGDGLLIERAYRGAYGHSGHDSGCAGRIALVGDGGRALDRATTGFA